MEYFEEALVGVCVCVWNARVKRVVCIHLVL